MLGAAHGMAGFPPRFLELRHASDILAEIDAVVDGFPDGDAPAVEDATCGAGAGAGVGSGGAPAVPAE